MQARREHLLIEPQKCTGCRRCMIACAMQHFDKPDPRLSRVKILTLNPQGLSVPIICMACEQAPCIKVCPMNARFRLKNGCVGTNTDVCIGCRACVYICPVGSPTVHPSSGQTMTCDMCWEAKEEPWCVTACRLEGALRLGTDWSKARTAARRRANQIRTALPARQ
ncbi:MAG: 4Fe-4S dicluster domain-containing protein [Desulfovermiculus sp.]|nr:4Fe-4S dicluster domain-containing protein [Desulfovermiculus sp.]